MAVNKMEARVAAVAQRWGWDDPAKRARMTSELNLRCREIDVDAVGTNGEGPRPLGTDAEAVMALVAALFPGSPVQGKAAATIPPVRTSELVSPGPTQSSRDASPDGVAVGAGEAPAPSPSPPAPQTAAAASPPAHGTPGIASDTSAAQLELKLGALALDDTGDEDSPMPTAARRRFGGRRKVIESSDSDDDSGDDAAAPLPPATAPVAPPVEPSSPLDVKGSPVGPAAAEPSPPLSCGSAAGDDLHVSSPTATCASTLGDDASAADAGDALADGMGRLAISPAACASPPSPPVTARRRPRKGRVIVSSDDDNDDGNDDDMSDNDVGNGEAADEAVAADESVASAGSDSGGSVNAGPPTSGPGEKPTRRRRLRRSRGVRVSLSSNDSSDDEDGGGGDDDAIGASPAAEVIEVNSDDSVGSLPRECVSSGENDDDSFIVYTSGEDDDSADDDKPFAPSPDSPPSRVFRPVATNTPAPPGKTPRRGGAAAARGGETPAKARVAFAQRREELALALYAEFNERAFGGVLPPAVAAGSGEKGAAVLPVAWSKTLNTTAGTTRLIRSGGVHSAEISLSTKVVDDEARLRNTLCHEMCHAAAFLQDRVIKPPHGAVFKKWAARAMRAYPILSIATCHSYQINFKFKWQCVTCRKEYGRHSNSINVQRQRCGACTGELKRMPRLKADGTPAKARQPSKWQMFCRDNMARVKRDNPGASHASIMDLLSQEYRSAAS